MNRDSTSEAKVRPLRERLREETARAIAAAAEEVFAARGLRDAKIEEIAARAGVSVGTVYNHFEDRTALFRHLVGVRKKELVQQLDESLAATAKQPFDQQLRHFARAVLGHFEQHREYCRISVEEGQQVAPSEAFKEVQERVEAIMKRGTQQKKLRANALWPTLFMGAARSFLVYDLRNPGALTLDQRTDAFLDFFLRGAQA